MTKHALLSASGAHRWMHCPPSARLAQSYKDEGSEYAAEGTAAHALAEARLRELFLEQTCDEPPGKYVTAEMREYIDAYCTIVQEHVNALTNPCVMLEQKLDFSDHVPEGFGTGDVVAIGNGVIEIIDLKYGKGVPVSADHNPQLMLYGLGAHSTFSMIYDIDVVRMTIVQPRLDSVSTFEMTAAELLQWAEETVKPLAALAYAGEGEYSAGDWCRFCPAKGECKARAEENMRIAQQEFKPIGTMTPEEMGALLSKALTFREWCNDLEAHMTDQAIHHDVHYPGWKVVEGRSNRVISDPDAVCSALHGVGFTNDQILTTKLNGITALEKTVGKKRFAELAGDYITKPRGKPVFVAEDDKRPALNSLAQAQKDFEILEDS